MDNKNNNSRHGIVIGLLIISLLIHVFFSKNPSLVGALETFGIVSLIFICLHLINIIADSSKTKDFFTKYYGARVKKILSPFYIILGILTFLGFMYFFSFHENRSFEQYSKFTLSMVGVFIFCFFIIPFPFLILSSNPSEVYDWALKRNINKKVAGILSILFAIVWVAGWVFAAYLAVVVLDVILRLIG